MSKATIILCTFALAVSMGLPLGAATHPAPPTGYDCVGGYNPSAYTNVCTTFAVSDPTTWASVGTKSTCAYLVGYLPGCVSHPYPNYNGPSTDVHVWIQFSKNCSTVDNYGACTILV